MTGSDFNFFPRLPGWAWWLVGATFAVGVLAILGGIGCGLYWLISHLRWV